MQQILETLAVFFVAFAAGRIVIALAYGIWDGIRERRHMRRKDDFAHRPSWRGEPSTPLRHQ